ncbi:MAG: 4-hydroxy-tetrahydrodipicolinate synthase [Halieaceae bacterium]|jgi:4-hydroxy-tetrahydrodipicolinate synthase|nr:4-hydroxy-tetrahydrodipicolinate synthase [Halieaceae bacterium]
MIRGSLVALVTPMHADGSLDWTALDALLDWHMESGTDGIVAVGTTGESATLAVDEHCEVIDRVIKRVAGRIPVIAGTGGNATAEAVQLTREAQALGADACLLVTPYYNKPTQEGLYQHYRHIAEAVSIPQILYNVPGRTGVDMLPATVARLADIDNITGIKEATGDLDRAREVIEICQDRMAVYSGDDATATELMLMGGDGTISVTANVAPAQLAEVSRLALAGEAEAAYALDSKLAALNEALFLESNPIPVKWALADAGRIEHGLRLPLTPLAEQYHAAVRAALAEATA